MILHFSRRLIAVVCLIAMVGVSAASIANAQSTDQTGQRVTDFTDVLSVAQFDSSLGDLVRADFAISGSFQSRVLQITNSSAISADFQVSTHVDLCADRVSVLASVSYLGCRSSSSPTSLGLNATALRENFNNLAPGATDRSAVPLQASDSANFIVTDPAALAEFIGTGSVNFGVATRSGFDANGAGGNSLVEVETYADVTISVNYRYANVSIVTTTNGGDGVPLSTGAQTNWNYAVTNTGNVELVNLNVTDDRNATVCTIAILAPGATQTCTATGVAGSANYNNVGSVTATPTGNTAITVSDDDPTSYVVVAGTDTAVPESSASPNPDAEALDEVADEVFNGLKNPSIDIELATNGVQADAGPGPQLAVNSAVDWSYVVTNNGTVDLRNVVVIDASSGEVCRQASLAIAQSFTCTTEGTATCGQQSRSARVQASSVNGVGVFDADPTHHTSSCSNSPATTNTVSDSPAPSNPAPVGPVATAPDSAKAAVVNADEVRAVTKLAFTGFEEAPARLGAAAFGLGIAALLASEGARRRAIRKNA